MDNKAFVGLIKQYEASSKSFLGRRMPAILVLNASKAFNVDALKSTTKVLCNGVQGCVFAYTIGTKIVLVLVDYKTPNSQPWFGGDVQRIVSSASALAAVEYYKASGEQVVFDAFIFNTSKEDVVNYFIYLQRSKIEELSRRFFKKLDGKSFFELEKMLLEKGVDECKTRGFGCCKAGYKTEDGQNKVHLVVKTIPLFEEAKNYMDPYVHF